MAETSMMPDMMLVVLCFATLCCVLQHSGPSKATGTAAADKGGVGNDELRGEESWDRDVRDQLKKIFEHAASEAAAAGALLVGEDAIVVDGADPAAAAKRKGEEAGVDDKDEEEGGKGKAKAPKKKAKAKAKNDDQNTPGAGGKGKGGGADASKPFGQSPAAQRRLNPDGTVALRPKPVPRPRLDPKLAERLAGICSHRTTVHGKVLPSVCMYTLLNCSDSLNGADISVDGSMLAACLADSTVSLWNLDPTSKEASGSGIPSGAAGGGGSKGMGGVGGWQAVVSQSRGLGAAAAVGAGAGGGGAKMTELFGGGASSVARSLGMASSEEDSRLKKRVAGVLRGHSGAVYSAAISVDGRLVASASEDGSVRVWTSVTNSVVLALKGHTHPVCVGHCELCGICGVIAACANAHPPRHAHTHAHTRTHAHTHKTRAHALSHARMLRRKLTYVIRHTRPSTIPSLFSLFPVSLPLSLGAQLLDVSRSAEGLHPKP